jgi:hypothetical protein
VADFVRSTRRARHAGHCRRRPTGEATQLGHRGRTMPFSKNSVRSASGFGISGDSVRDKVTNHANIVSCCNWDTLDPIERGVAERPQIDALYAHGYSHPRREQWSGNLVHARFR